MTIIRAFIIALSIYSRIPVPIFDWEEKDMKYHLVFFPFVGAVIAGLMYGWFCLAAYLGVANLPYTLIGVAIPLIVTGGFHVDGFMDTMDAFKSYKGREEKLEILKDPHIGAFSVLMLSLAGLIYAAAYSELGRREIVLLGMGFVLSRALSAVAVIIFPTAKKDGMLHTFSMSAQISGKKTVLVFVLAEVVLMAGIMLSYDVIKGLVCILTAIISFAYYRYKAMKELGGTTGDLAGYFVTVTEIAMAVSLWIMTYCME